MRRVPYQLWDLGQVGTGEMQCPQLHWAEQMKAGLGKSQQKGLCCWKNLAPWGQTCLFSGKAEDQVRRPDVNPHPANLLLMYPPQALFTPLHNGKKRRQHPQSSGLEKEASGTRLVASGARGEGGRAEACSLCS